MRSPSTPTVHKFGGHLGAIPRTAELLTILPGSRSFSVGTTSRECFAD
jgi:hypothetical protein